jgi:hypothetical protein
MKRMGTTETTIFLYLQLVRRRFLVFGGRIIPPFTFTTRQRNQISHNNLSNQPAENLSTGTSRSSKAPRLFPEKKALAPDTIN